MYYYELGCDHADLYDPVHGQAFIPDDVGHLLIQGHDGKSWLQHAIHIRYILYIRYSLYILCILYILYLLC